MSERDERIGQNVAALRGERSQKSVADAMRERGWKWSQSTVWSVEKGDRPLKLAEAEDLVDVLGSDSIHMLTGQPLEAQIQAWMHRAAQEAFHITRSVIDFLEATEQLRLGIEESKKQGVRLRAIQAKGGGWLDDRAIDLAVQQGRFEHEQHERHAGEFDEWLESVAEDGSIGEPTRLFEAPAPVDVEPVLTREWQEIQQLRGPDGRVEEVVYARQGANGEPEVETRKVERSESDHG